MAMARVEHGIVQKACPSVCGRGQNQAIFSANKLPGPCTFFAQTINKQQDMPISQLATTIVRVHSHDTLSFETLEVTGDDITQPGLGVHVSAVLQAILQYGP
jgi:hypothetical protein